MISVECSLFVNSVCTTNTSIRKLRPPLQVVLPALNVFLNSICITRSSRLIVITVGVKKCIIVTGFLYEIWNLSGRRFIIFSLILSFETSKSINFCVIPLNCTLYNIISLQFCSHIEIFNRSHYSWWSILKSFIT